MVILHDVVRVGDPETGGGLICVQQRECCSRGDNQVAVDYILGLGRIFNEDGVAHDIVCNVVEHIEVVDAVDGHSSVVGLMDRVAFNNRLSHTSDHVEMDWISTQLKSLAHIVELCV